LCGFHPILRPSEVVTGDHERFDEGTSPGTVSFGLARLNEDNRKIPLGWWAFDNCATVGHTKPVMSPTLALASIVALDPDALKDFDLETLQKKRIASFYDCFSRDSV
jgi:hypothetical protein